MTTAVRSSITVARSPERIAAIMLDPDRAPLWNKGLERFEVLTQAPGLVGSRARLHYAQGRRRHVMEDELLEVTPNRRFLSRVSGKLLEAHVETLLEPAGDGTRVSIHWTGRGRSRLIQAVLALTRRSLARQIHADLEALKRVAEAE